MAGGGPRQGIAARSYRLRLERLHTLPAAGAAPARGHFPRKHATEVRLRRNPVVQVLRAARVGDHQDAPVAVAVGRRVPHTQQVREVRRVGRRRDRQAGGSGRPLSPPGIRTRRVPVGGEHGEGALCHPADQHAAFADCGPVDSQARSADDRILARHGRELDVEQGVPGVRQGRVRVVVPHDRLVAPPQVHGVAVRAVLAHAAAMTEAVTGDRHWRVDGDGGARGGQRHAESQHDPRQQRGSASGLTRREESDHPRILTASPP